MSKAVALFAVGTSNGVSLAASLGGLLATTRLLGPEAFAGYAVALALQALVAVLPNGTGPGCGRRLSRDPGEEAACRGLRLRTGWAAAGLLLAGGLLWSWLRPGGVPPLGWLLLSLQMPLAAWEAHRLQVLQMRGDFVAHAWLQPRTRVLKALGLGLLLWGEVPGILPVLAVPLLAQASLLLPRLPERGKGSLPWDAEAGWNALSGGVVWGGTRANLLLSAGRLDAHGTACYGLADTLAASLLVVVQSAMTLVQPGIYRWDPTQGLRPLLRRAGLVAGAGALACAGAALLARPVLGWALPTGWDGTAEAFAVLCLGCFLQSLVAVAAALLHRFERARTVLLLEASAALALLAGAASLSVGGTATDAAWVWSLGRGVWAVGGIGAALWVVRRVLRG